jgi:hypothetical protein
MTVVQDIDYDEFESIIFGEETTETYEVQISDIEVRVSNYYFPGILYYNVLNCIFVHETNINFLFRSNYEHYHVPIISV